jgi:hypothetical protein
MDFERAATISPYSRYRESTVTLRSFVIQALLRAVLVCAAFYVGFIVIDARAQHRELPQPAVHAT